jgi:threonine synthase
VHASSKKMLLESTSHGAPAVSFREALVGGLAPDGGLYLPVDWPAVGVETLQRWQPMPFADLSARIATRLLAGEFEPDVIERLVHAALDFPVPTIEVEPGRFVLELFHGPTLAFKDFGARFLARFFSHLLAGRGEHATILVATSGDTGSAVAQGFYGVARVNVVVLYPRGKVSRFQESQMATLGGNVTAVRVEGTFDDCQRLVKTAFLDRELAPLRLSSANSINIGRLLPQTFYYVAGYLATVRRVGEPIVFSVPTGNVGDLTAGVLAQRLGVPVSRFIAATNANRVLPDYLASGVYSPRPSIATSSNAMDVGDPSNFARLLALHGGSVDVLRANVTALSVDEEESRRAMRRLYERTGYVMDPHTAVGWAAADRYSGEDGGRLPLVTLATAHPAKFDKVIREELGMAPPLPAQGSAEKSNRAWSYEGWEKRPTLAVDLEGSDYDQFRRLLRERLPDRA